MGNGQIGFIYLRVNSLDFYSSKSTNGAHLDFAQTSVRDLELINKVELVEKIKSFVDQNKIPPSNIIIVLSDSVYFEKDFLDLPIDQQDIAVNNFLENVPFESVASRLYTIERGVKIVAANKELYQAIKEAFESKGFVIESVTPSIILGSSLIDEAGGLNIDSVTTIFNKYNLLKQNNLDINKISINTSSQKKENPYKAEHTINKRLIVLAAFFVVLLVILVMVIVSSFKNSS